MAEQVYSNWDGSPLMLNQNDSAVMPNTPVAQVIFEWQSQAPANDGVLILAVGGGQPETLNAPAHTGAPSTKAANWQGNMLTVTNVSIAPATPILITLKLA